MNGFRLEKMIVSQPVKKFICPSLDAGNTVPN